MQEVGRVIGKYFVPILLIIIGLGLLLFSKDQTALFLFGGLAILIVGILSLLYIKGIISKNLQVIFIVVVALGSMAFAYLDYAVIDDQLEYEKKNTKIETHIIQRLKDIRKAQLAYLKENGKFASSFDSLTYFLKSGELTLIKRLGSLPDSVPTDEMARELGIISPMPEGMTDEEAMMSGLIIRDTIQVTALTYIFNEDDARTRKTPFYIDSLPFVPFANHRFEMNAATIESGGVRQPVFEAFDPKPFAEPLKVGSLTEANTAGNWKE